MEGGLWSMFDKAETHVKGSGELEQDPAVTAYVRGVICKIAAEYCPELRDRWLIAVGAPPQLTLGWKSAGGERMARPFQA